MQRVATVTKIKGNGDVEVIMNGIVSEEIKRLRQHELNELEQKRKEFEKEMEWMNMIKKQRDKLLQEKYENINIKTKRHESLRDRAKETIGFTIACFLCWSEMLGLIEYIGPKKGREKK